MATRLYFHAATNSTANLPTTEQSALTAAVTGDALTLNRSMDTTVGTSQTSITVTTLGQTAIQNLYFARFVSEPLASGSISANTWTYNFAAAQPSIAGNFPVASSAQPVRIVCYVWRPGTGKLGNILDGNSGNGYSESTSINTEKVYHGSFTGASVASVQGGDVVIFEVWFEITQSNTTSRLDVYYFDGTTANTTPDTTVSNHASFIETPQNLVFGGGTTTVSQTTIQKYNILMYIPQTSIQKYSLRKYLAQTSIHKYSLRTFLAQASIQKYNLRKFLAQTSIHKYNLKQLIASASIQKYNLRKYLAQTTIHKYGLRKFLSQISIQKYNLSVYDSFDAGTYSFTEGGPSPNGKWTNVFLGGGTGGVRTSGSRTVMWLKPQVSTTAGETHAGENKSAGTWTNFDYSFRMRTISQLRTGSAPNAWEVAWVIFRYTDDWHHYYFLLKSTGPEFGRKDYFPHVEQQMFLATPATPTLTLNQWYDIRIKATGNHFWIYIDGALAIDMIDDGSVGYDSQTAGLPPPPSAAMYTGSFNPYTEDAEVEFDDVCISGLSYLAQVVIQKYNILKAVTQTTIHKYSIRKFITQPSIQKYNVSKYLVQNNIQKYNLRAFLAQASIHKYSLRKFLAQTSIHKYSIVQISTVIQTTIQKYNLRKNIIQATIQKYDIRKTVAITTSIQKYAILKAVIQASIQKYNLKKLILQTSIQKYSLGGVVLQLSKHKYTLRVFVSVANSIQKYAIRKAASQTSIHKYAMRAMVLQTSTQKYNIAGIGMVDMTEVAAKSYANKFITRV